MLKKIVAAVLLALPMIASAQSVKIGLVDTESLLSAMPDTKTAQEEIANLAKQYESEFAKFQEEAQKQLEEFQNLPESTSQLTRERKAKELREMEQKMAEFENNARTSLQKAQNEKMSPIISRIRTAIESVGKEGGYTLIQEINSVLYYGGAAENVTPAVKAKLGLK